jgi:SAM-dependent methyltransferase
MIWDEHKISAITNEPYQALSKIYDKLMAHVEYPQWADFIVRLLRRESYWPQKVLELACGTGILAAYLENYGLQVVGYDRSPAMIEVARRKFLSPNVRFEVASFSDFPLQEKFPAAICLYDSINYIMDFTTMVDFLKRVKEVLLPRGVFIFDICTRHNSWVNFRNYVDQGNIDGIHYHRYSTYNLHTHIHINDFVLYQLNHQAHEWREHHEQYIYSVGEIVKALKLADLKLEAKFDDIRLEPARWYSFRIHFLTRKLS